MQAKIIHTLLLLLLTVATYGETLITSSCERLRRQLGYPHYYCYCKEESETFAFPQERNVSDTLWFTATLDDLKQGMTAYWFSDDSVSMDVYALCNSKNPTMSFTVGSHRMMEKSVEEINEKIQEFGDLGELIGAFITPHIRIYPHQKGNGKVYCYPYNQGPHSTCENILPVYASMTYVSNHADDVYELRPEQMPESGRLFVHWKEEKNRPCTLSIAETCDGAPLYTARLADSLGVYWVDSTLLRQHIAAQTPLYFHFAHNAAHVGRIRFSPDPRYRIRLADSTLCQGISEYSIEDTVVVMKDTIWQTAHTLTARGYRLITLPPDTLRDTVLISKDMLTTDGCYYPAADTILYEYGDYEFTIEQPMQCTYVVALHIEETPIQTELTSPTHSPQAKLLYRKDIGIYILRDGKRYNLLGQTIDE